MKIAPPLGFEPMPAPAPSFAGNAALVLVVGTFIVAMSAALIALHGLLVSACTPVCP